MPLVKSASQKAVGENIEREEAAGKPHKQALAIALSVQRAAKSKKMAKGGEVENPKLAESHKEPMKPKSDHEEHYESIADAILRKKRMAEGGMVELDETNAEEGELPEMSSELEGLDEEAVEQSNSVPGSLADRIRAKSKAKK